MITFIIGLVIGVASTITVQKIAKNYTIVKIVKSKQ